MYPVILPHEAVLRTDQEFYTALYWRYFPVMVMIRDHHRANSCGTLRSVRFTSSRPKKSAAAPQHFLCDRIIPILDAASYLAEARCTSLILNKTGDMNLAYVLAQFETGLVVEIEVNECLPDTMPEIAFVKANFTNGHITNQPLVGFFNEEGMICADDHGCRQFIAQSGGNFTCGPYENMKSRFDQALEKGEILKGESGCRKWLKMLEESQK